MAHHSVRQPGNLVSRTRRLGASAAAVLVALTLACRASPVLLEAGHVPTADGLAMSFHLRARAPGLERVILSYGDGLADSTLVHGADRMSGTFLHTYQRAGRYEARAEAVLSSGRRAAKRVRIRVGRGE